MPKAIVKFPPSRSALARLQAGATGKELAEFYERLEAACPIAAMQVRLVEAFKLRPLEVLQIQLTTAVEGDSLRVPGRPRQPLVRIETDQQSQLIERAKRLADADGFLRSKRRPLKSALRDLRYHVPGRSPQGRTSRTTSTTATHSPPVASSQHCASPTRRGGLVRASPESPRAS